MNITTRLAVLLCVIMMLFLCWIVYVQRTEEKQAELILSTNINSNNTGFDRILKLEGASFETFVYDYSCRNDLYAFVQQHNTTWSAEHLKSLLPTFNLYAVWIYRSDLSCLYAASLMENQLPCDVPLPNDALHKLFSQRYFHHFFVQLPAGLLEMRSAPIQAGLDWERKGRPAGFLFASRLWDRSYIENLTTLTESSISLRRAPDPDKFTEPSYDFDNGTITYSRIFQSWDKRPVIEMIISSKAPILKESDRSRQNHFILLLSFSGIVLVALYIAMIVWVSRPLRQISRSLATGTAAPLARLQHTQSEYGNLARLISAFFRQRDDLALEIAERKRVEDALLESEERFRSIAELSPDAIVIAEADFKIVFWNAAAENIFGYTSAEALGASAKMLVPTARKVIHTNNLRNLLTNGTAPGEGKIIEATALRKGHIEFPVEASLATWTTIQMKTYCSMIVRDITLRKKAEQALNESERKYRELVENANSIILRWRPTGEILFFNEFAQRFFGFTEQEIIGKNIVGTIVPEYDSSGNNLAAMIRDISHHPEQYHLNQNENICRDGRRVWISWSNKDIKDESGQVVEFLSVGSDLTDRKKMEEQLQHSQKMEAIGTLAGGIAHDFNNILGAIIGYTEMSQSAIPQDNAVQHNLSQVLKAADRAKNLVRQILVFSQKTGHDLRPVAMHVIINEAIRLLRALIPSTIEIKLSLAESSDIVIADATQIHQVIMNLCTNAAHAMQRNGGLLEITLKSIDLDVAAAQAFADIKPGPHVQLSVRDTGSGIPPENIDRIFEPFFTTKELGKGTGMGLSVVHGIIRKHQGAIKVYSEPGKGTIFHVLLPRAVLSHSGAAEVSVPPPLGKENILLIDDEEMLLIMGKSMLESLGYNVTTKQSSLQALEAFQKDPVQFDLIITDQTMPRMTGDNLAKEIMQVRPDIPIILCTGYSELVSEEKARELGIRAFVMKPINRMEIAETIRRVLDDTPP